MLNENAFTIYNASAGSGKTHTLVKEYLKILLKSKSPLAFKSILALTFTNKAVAEMKERIIKMLQEFSDQKSLTNHNAMFEDLVRELSMNPIVLHQQSKVLLETIMHNYAGFDISTIDKFNHKLIRTFAHDLKLPLNFEVELDTIELLSKAVDKLIDKAGTDDRLTKILVDFAIEKADDDKSWDVAWDFNNIAKLLINENDIPHINTIKDKTLDDFSALKSHLTKQVAIVEKAIISIAKKTLELIASKSLEHSDFSRKTLPNHFLKAADLDIGKLYDNQLQTNLAERKGIYNKTLDAVKSNDIDSILPELEKNYLEMKKNIFEFKFLNSALKNITPLSVLNAINTSLEELKEENDLLLISEFNTIISKEINLQPAPFIYERIGEKFKHYFIDEFQDTSVLQWENLIPLIDNKLSGEDIKGETGTAMLVGDAKQAIYRWRGGKAEQFIDLYTKKKKPFIIEQDVRNLPDNHRSAKNIVSFNNSFFKHLSEYVFSNKNHESIYRESTQNFKKTIEGSVELSFLDVKNMEEDEDKYLLHCQKVYDTILKVQTNGFELKDICIITRKSKEGIAIAEYLSSAQIPVVSSESLLLKNSPEVNFMNNMVTLASQQNNNILKTEVLSYLAEYKLHLEDKHSFYEQLVHLEIHQLFKRLENHGFVFSFNSFMQQPLYEAIETVVRQFNLNDTSNAYVQFYMDEIFDFSKKHNASFTGFAAHWNAKKDKLSVVSPQGNNAVQIMTIHKSKGLEFPVVIFPFANQDIYFDRQPKAWFSVAKEDYAGFPNLFLNLNKELDDFGEQGNVLYSNYRSELELDTINLLYVVLTRAIEQLYIISELDIDSKGNEKLNWYSGLFINYLKASNRWVDSETSYIYGSLKRSSSSEEKNNAVTPSQFISVSREYHKLHIMTNSGYLWDTAQEKAIEKGNLVHNIMSKIKSFNDVNYVLNDFLEAGKINQEQLELLKPIVNQIVYHPELKAYFEEPFLIYNEKDIITVKEEVLRPDRVVIDGKKAVIIDYKTGTEKEFHFAQLLRYQEVLEEMDLIVLKKILIYINEEIHIKEF
jgi:ATP-dependent exoDNAse (exonuclease V) beta subunit